MPSKNNKKVLHRVRVKLYPNHLPNVKGKYIARTYHQDSLTIEDICASLKIRGGFTGNYDDLVNHVRQFFDEAAYKLCDGFSVNTGYFSVHPVFGGTFDSENDEYDRKKHPISFRFNARAKLRAIVKNVNVIIDGLADNNGGIYEFFDYESDSINETATPGSMFQLTGHKIKVSGNDPAVGVYFVSEDDPADEVKVKSSLVTNAVSRIVSIVPPLKSGAWRAAIRTQYSRGSFQLKEPKLITSGFTLVI